MIREITDYYDEIRGLVRFVVDEEHYVLVPRAAVITYGKEKVFEMHGIEYTPDTRLLPVFKRERLVGYLPACFDPREVSGTFLYEIRPGDFRREGDRWIACPTLGPGDLEAAGVQLIKEPHNG